MQKINFITKLKTEFICFIETNQRDNINNPSGWYMRLQNIYLALAEHTQEYHDIKITSWKNISGKDLT